MRVVRVLSTVLLVLATITVTSRPASAGPPVSPAPSVFLGGVTLITGDHVTVRRVGTKVVPVVTPAAGREHTQFATSQVDDQLLVVPSDAWPALNAGRLDRRLFDVAALLRDGFGDADRSDLPLIAQGVTGVAATQHLSTLGAMVLRQPKVGAAEFWANHRGARIWLDGMRKPSLDTSVPQIGAPTAWQDGLNGKDVRVAVLDTGIDDTHPDFRGQLAEIRNFTTDPDARDAVGHGTHVASILAGTGRASGGRYTGVAPGARLLIGKVCQGGGCPESAILAGMEWAAAAGAKVVNLSLGGPDAAGDDLLEEAVNRLSAERGTLFVIAAGNDGGLGAETVDSPSSADAALSVGAVDKQDGLAGFSSRGPRFRDAALKPEIVAPGVEITAARSRFSLIGKRGERYVALSGTSMATPHVAGAAAILVQAHPTWTGAQLKAALMGSAHRLDNVGTYEQGAGRVDVARAIRLTAFASPAAVSVGRQPWPHEDDAPVGKTVTYQNAGSLSVTLGLTLVVTGPDGAPVPDGMFRLSGNQVTVAPGGTASVSIVTETAMPAAEGAFSAHIVATQGNTRITTPVAVDREPESYDLTLRPIDANGNPTDLEFSFVFGIDRARFRPVPVTGGTGTLRVRKGTYLVDAAIATARGDGLFNSSKVTHPTVVVTGDTTVTLDARTTAPIAIDFDRGQVSPRAVAAGYSRFTEHSTLFTGILGDDFGRIFIGQVGDSLPRQELVADISGTWADATGSVTYNLAWFDYGHLPFGFARHIVDSDLAAVVSTYRAQERGKRGTKVWTAREPELGIAVGQGFAFDLPLTRTEYHNVDSLRWSGEFQQWRFVKRVVHTETIVTGGVVSHQPGQSYVEDWNTAVFGPGFPGETEWAARFDNTLFVNIPMYSDSMPNHSGVSEVDSAATVLFRDGIKVGETTRPGQGQFDVPPELAQYRLEARSTRSGVSALSTDISCVWTFSSVRPPDPEPDPKTLDKPKGGNALPLMSIRFAPPNLNPRNILRARSVILPITVQKPQDSPESTLTGLTLDVSSDDGYSWQPVTVTRTGFTATARIVHPGNADHISLRARATDSLGNTVEQTIIRAYGVA
jgi:subtilisin family serine protease